MPSTAHITQHPPGSTLVFSFCPKQHALIKRTQRWRAFPFSHAQVCIADNNVVLAYCSKQRTEQLIYVLTTLVEQCLAHSVIILYPTKSDFSKKTQNNQIDQNSPPPSSEEGDEHSKDYAGATNGEVSSSHSLPSCIRLAYKLTHNTDSIYLDIPPSHIFPDGLVENVCMHPACLELCRALLVHFSHAELFFAHCTYTAELNQCFQFLLTHIAKKNPSLHSKLLSQCAQKFHCTQTELAQIDSFLQTVHIYEDVHFLNTLQGILTDANTSKAMKEKLELIALLQKRIQEYHAPC